MKHPVFAATLLTIAALASFSPIAYAAQVGDPDCLQPVNLRGWKVIDDRTIIADDTSRRNYKVSLQPGCTGLSFSLGLHFRTFGSRLSCMTRGDSVMVPPGGGMPMQRCVINMVQAYTPEMQHADAAAKAMDKPH